MTLQAIKGKSPYLADLIDFGCEEMDGGIILVKLILNGHWSFLEKRCKLYSPPMLFGIFFNFLGI